MPILRHQQLLALNLKIVQARFTQSNLNSLQVTMPQMAFRNQLAHLRLGRREQIGLKRDQADDHDRSHKQPDCLRALKPLK